MVSLIHPKQQQQKIKMQKNKPKLRTIKKEIQSRLVQLEHELSHHEKLYQANKLFTFISHHKYFLDKYKKFKDTVALKLLDLYHVENIKEAKSWWVSIFDQPIPPQ